MTAIEAKDRSELKEANAERERAVRELDSERKALEASRAALADQIEAVQKEEKAAKIRAASLTKRQGEVAEASTVLAGSEKSLKEEHAAPQREEGKNTRRERDPEEKTKRLSDREKELRVARGGDKAPGTKIES